jgi:hypothetical protein
MTTKKISGIVMIVIGVLMLIFGLLALISNYDSASQIQAMNSMMGGLGNSMMGGARDAITNGYIKGGLISVLGLVLSILGIRLTGNKKSTS